MFKHITCRMGSFLNANLITIRDKNNKTISVNVATITNLFPSMYEALKLNFYNYKGIEEFLSNFMELLNYSFHSGIRLKFFKDSNLNISYNRGWCV